MKWLLAGYIWLSIHRPFEIWPMLSSWHIERNYAIVLLGSWLLLAEKSWPQNRLQIGVGLFSCVVVLGWLASPFSDDCWSTVENYLRILVFYVIFVSSIRDSRTLKFVIGAFLVAMALYMGHSLWEYFNGRFNYRMGTRRMIAVDTSYGNPNAFAGTIAYALPFTLWFLTQTGSVRDRLLAMSYALLSATCILLTGSRSGLVGLLIFAASLLGLSRRRLATAFALAIVGPAAWILLPQDRQDRFLTMIESDMGPATAYSSMAGRAEGFWDGIRIWQEHPVLGVGPGAHQKVSYHGRPLHNLYGQIVADTGTAGLLVFGLLLAGFLRNHLELRRIAQASPVADFQWLYSVSKSVMVGLVVLLVLGYAGHSLFRYHWYWFAAFQVATMECAKRLQHSGLAEDFEQKAV